ncbi:MAG: PDDEXK nuclease domain-containing protein [Chitinophagales bacterium]
MKEIDIQTTSDYKDWLLAIKAKIATTQVRIATAANSVLLNFYWEFGKDISIKTNEAKWGSKVIDQLATDLKIEIPQLKGFSRTNLYYIKQFYEVFSQPDYQKLFIPQSEGQNQEPIIPQLGGQIPWGHIKVILSKTKTATESHFYIKKILANHWNRDVLALQIKSQLHLRQGNAITNFEHTLPEAQSELAKQTIKDPYLFDFLTLVENFKEKDLEIQLIEHVSKFLLELGKGFAFFGKQYHIEVAEQDYYLDLLFYHTTLKCYVVIELKNTKFIPEYAGKLNFYLSAIDDKLKQESDKPSIGILLCRDKNNLEVEFALRGMSQPMGVSEFNLTEILPEDLKSSLPTIEEIEEELKK